MVRHAPSDFLQTTDPNTKLHIIRHLTQPIAQEDFIKFSRHRSIRSYAYYHLTKFV